MTGLEQLAQETTGKGISDWRSTLLSVAGLAMPITLRPQAAMTDEEFLKFSHRNWLYRMERNAQGELEIMSPTGWDGSGREEFAAQMLANWADKYGGKARGPTAGFRLADNSIRSPDACWVSTARLAGMTAEQKKRFLPICPEFLIEILSESDSRLALESKMQMWIEAGALLAWLIDPFQAEVLIYRPGLGPEVLKRPEWVEAATVVPGFRLQMASLWA